MAEEVYGPFPEFYFPPDSCLVLVSTRDPNEPIPSSLPALKPRRAKPPKSGSKRAYATYQDLRVAILKAISETGKDDPLQAEVSQQMGHSSRYLAGVLGEVRREVPTERHLWSWDALLQEAKNS
jgi:hypothetical protein